MKPALQLCSFLWKNICWDLFFSTWFPHITFTKVKIIKPYYAKTYFTHMAPDFCVFLFLEPFFFFLFIKPQATSHFTRKEYIYTKCLYIFLLCIPIPSTLGNICTFTVTDQNSWEEHCLFMFTVEKFKGLSSRGTTWQIREECNQTNIAVSTTTGTP